MSAWWLLWPLAGFIAWGWGNHAVTSIRCAYDGDFLYVSPLSQFFTVLANLILGPVALLVSGFFVITMYPPKHRWGLRFRFW